MSLATLGHSQSTLGKPNFDSIIERLMRLNPAQRQQFAQLHADDPLMLSAAKYADSEIKKIDQAYLAKQSGAAPPKINEQVVQAIGQPVQPPPPPQGQPAGQPPPPPPQGQPQAAQALPENSGIAQLPAPNMQGMAGGGIVAFARGDVVKGADGMDYYEGEGGKMFEAGSTEATIDAAKVNVPKAYNALKEGFNQIDFAGNEAGIVGSALAGSKAPVAAPTGPSRNPAIPLPPSGAGAGRGMGGAPAPKVVSSDVLAERLAAPKTTAAGDRPPAMPTMKTTSDSDILATYKKIQDTYGPSSVKEDPFAAQTQAVLSATQDVGNRQTADAEARERGLKALLSSKEGRIKEREGRIQGAEDLNTKMAIINAGLAMMQSTGKGLAGIAEGATVGAKQYAEGMKASELARQKIEDARDAFDELRFNQESMTAKEKTAAYATIKNGTIAAQKAFVENVQHKQGLNEKQATSLFEKTVQAQLEAQKEQNALALENLRGSYGIKAAAAHGAAGTKAQLDLLSAYGGAQPGTPLYAGLQMKMTEAMIPRMFENYTTKVSDTTPAGGGKYETKGQEFKAMYPTPEAYAADYQKFFNNSSKNTSANSGFVQNPSGGPVLPR
jgi:hypothetical protein